MRGPLRHRIANPPIAFLGRETEEGALREALRRGPVAVVCGDAGLGKTALVERVLRDAAFARVVRCRAGLTFVELGQEMLVALGADAGTGDALEDALDDALVVQLLDAAEAAESVLVLEDTHLLDVDVVTRWLVALASFARTSRWVVTSRTTPHVPSLQEQVVRLGALDPLAARALATACAMPCTPSDIDAIVHTAEGSPRRLRALAAGRAQVPSLATTTPPVGVPVPSTPAPAQPKLGELEAVLQGDLSRVGPIARTPERGVGAALGAQVRSLLDGEPQDGVRALGMRGVVVAGMRLISQGRGSRGGQVLRALQQHAELPSGLNLLTGVAQGLLRVTGGRYTGLTLVSRELLREAEHLGNTALYHWAFMFERLVSLSASADTPEPVWAGGIAAPTGISARYLTAVRVAHRARRGERVPDEQLPRVQPGDGPLAVCVCEFLETHVCLLRGDAERAEVLAATLVRRCVTMRVPLVEGEALLMLCYAQLTLARVDELRASVDALARVGRSARSRRYTVIADLLRMALDPDPNIARLMKIARHRDASPTAARVASALLGAAPADDALDRLLVDGLAARWTTMVQPLREGQRADWVFDPASSVVFVGQRSEPASPLAMRILCCLFDAAASTLGYARLEDVARIVWDVVDYHPLRDAKRVHVAIRRLRTLIEEDSSNPTRLITVDGGYTLAQVALPGRVVSR